MKNVIEYELYEDIQDIQDHANVSKYPVSMVLHAPKDEIEVFAVPGFDKLSDYESSFHDVIMVNCFIPMGEFVNRFLPFRDLLEADLSIGDVTTRYRVIVPNDVLQFSENIYQTANLNLVNEHTAETLRFQLVALHAEPSRMATISNVFSGTLDVIIPNIFKHAMSTIEIGGNSLVSKVIMQEPDNKKEYDQLVIPSHTPVMDVVTYIQKEYGIYYRGANRYLSYEKESPVWNIYDMYNPVRYNDKQTKIRCFLIPPGMDTPMVHTWSLENDIFSFICTVPVEDTGKLDPRTSNRPTGFSYQTADKIIGGDILVEGGTPYGSNDNVSKEVILTKRPDGIIDRPAKGITNNKFGLITEQSRNHLNIKTLMWHSCNPFFLLPGDTMSIYMTDPLNEIIEYKSTILKTHTIFKQNDGSMGNNSAMTGTMILTVTILNRY